MRISQPHFLSVMVLAAAAALPVTGIHAQSLQLDNVAPIALTSSAVQNAMTLDAQTGNISVRSVNGNLNQCTGTTTTPVIDSFGPSAATVAPNAAFSLSWVSQNTTGCTPTMGAGTTWASLGSLPSSGSANLTAPATAGAITFQLTCTDGSQNVNRQTQVTVQSTPGTCQPVYPVGSIAEYNNLVNGSWPAYGGNFTQTVDNGHWVALRFVANNVPTQYGTISASAPTGAGGILAQVSISTSPGCFDETALGARCLSPVTTLPGVSWNHQSNPFTCKLTPGAEYYVNLYFPECPSGRCELDIGNIQQLKGAAPPTAK